MICAYCGDEIHEGMHYLDVVVKTQTVMPETYTPARDVQFPPEVAGPFCCPLHLIYALLDSPELRDTFGR